MLKLSEDNNTILSFCIPTYNRADCLSRCLISICNQIKESEYCNRIEILISDNNSPDNTPYIVNYINNLYPMVTIHYYKRDINDVERNFIETVNRAHGKYAWLFGDDDILLENAINTVLPILVSNDYGFLMVNKNVGNQDLSQIILPTQNDTSINVEYPNILEFTKKYGLLTNLAFFSTSIFLKENFSNIYVEPYISFNCRFSQCGILIEAFYKLKCLYICNILVTQRQFNTQIDTYHLTVPLVKMVKYLKDKGIIEYNILDEISEGRLTPDQPISLTQYMLAFLSGIVSSRREITSDEWKMIFEVFSSTKEANQAKELYNVYNSIV